LGGGVSGDPIGVGDGGNIYRYSSNNPIVLNDINGKQTAHTGWAKRQLQTTTVKVESESDPEPQQGKNGENTIIPPAVLFNSRTGELIERNNYVSTRNQIWVVDPNSKDYDSTKPWASATPLTYEVGKKEDIEAGRPTGVTGDSLRQNHPLYTQRQKVTKNFAMPRGGQVYLEDLLDLTKEFNQILKDNESHFFQQRLLFEKSDCALLFVKKALWFRDQVTDNHDFDLKSDSRKNLNKIQSYAAIVIGEWTIYEGRLTRYDDYGNISFGYWGRTFGYEEQTLLEGSDTNQFFKFFEKDEPRDKMAIKIGFLMYNFNLQKQNEKDFLWILDPPFRYIYSR